MAKAPNGNGQVRDITTMSAGEIEAFLKEKKAEQARIAAQRGVEVRKELEAYCEQKYGLTLAQVFMASSNSKGPRTYKHPTTGSLYIYSGRGKVPDWLHTNPGGKAKGDKKPNPQYEVRTN